MSKILIAGAGGTPSENVIKSLFKCEKNEEIIGVNQRAKLTRVLGKTALKSFHPRLYKIRYFIGASWR